MGIVFSDPGVAFVGKRLGELKPDIVVVGEVSFEVQARAIMAQRNHGLMRL